MMVGKQRSVAMDAPNYFLGWEAICNYCRKAVEIDREVGRESDFIENQRELYFVTLFVTASRVSEALLLKPSQVSVSKSGLGIRVDRMEVLKHRIKGHRKRVTRIIYINREVDRLADRFLELCQDCKTEYLLTRREQFTGKPLLKGHTTRVNVYNKILEIDEKLWPHVLRDQKCYQLSAKKEDGGQEYDIYDLRAFIGWARIDQATTYIGRRKEVDAARAAGLPEGDVPEGGDEHRHL